MTNLTKNLQTPPPPLESGNLATTTLPPLPTPNPTKASAKEQKLAMIGVAGIVALILISWLISPSQAPAVAVVAPTLANSPLFTQTPPATENADGVSLQLSSTPTGARVVCFVGGEPVEVEPTPSTLTVAKGAQVELTFVAPGYEPKQKVVSADKEQAVAVTLSEPKKATGGRSSGGFGPGH